MAGPCTCRNSCSGGKNELVRGISRVLIKSNNTPTFPLVISLVQILVQAQSSASASIPGPPDMYTNMDLQKTNMLVLKLFNKGQKHSQANSAFWNRVFKA